MSASQGPEANEGGKRRAQARAVAEECLRRRAAGESLTDDQVLAAHPDIAAELAEELAKARLIGQARRAADEAPTVSEASGRPMIGTAGQAGRGTPALPDGAASDAEEESLPPSSFKVPGYSIIREISRGGQAVVFEALQESTGRKVAIKVLREGPFLTARQRARFDREVQILAALKHPNIVSIIDRGATEHGAQYLVMDYIEGRTLDQYLAEFRDKHGDAPPDPSQMLRLFLKIADAVNAAHLRGIVHRDLKPSNIRVDSRGEPHILDFGLASVSAVRSLTDESVPQPVTLTGQFLGSLPWASPEQAEGLPDKIDIRSDVYSLGVVLYQMLTGGHFPYEVAGTMRDVLNNIIMVAPTPPSQVIEARLARKMQGRRGRFRRRKAVNEVIEAIVLKSLAKGPEQRYQSAGDFARDIGNYLSGQPTIAAGMAALRRQRRSRLVRVAAVAGGIVAACGLTAAVMLTVIVPRYFAPAPPVPPPAVAPPNTLTDAEKAAGWKLLFDGKTLAGWHPWPGRSLDDWKVEDGCLVTAGVPNEERKVWGYLSTDDEYGDFELAFQWKVSAGANSGIKYRSREDLRPEAAPEYQVLDNERQADGKIPKTSAGAVFGVLGPDSDVMRPAGQFNDSRIVCQGTHVEHWLNGKKILEYDTVGEVWEAASRTMVNKIPGFGLNPRGAITLQNLVPVAWYRNMKIRPLGAAPAAAAPPPAAPETLVRPGQWIDVLALVDPQRDTVSGEWQRQGQTVSVSLPTAKWGCVVIPVAPGGDYELEVRFVRLSGQDEVGVSLPVGDAAVNLCLSENGGVTGGLGLINGKNICDNETAVNPTRLENGREYVVRAQVASDGPNATIEVALDGKPYTAWGGPRAALSREEEKRLPRHNCLGLRAVGSTVAFLSARLRMLSGAAMLLGAAPAPSAAPASADDAFLKEVAALPAEEQVKRVVAKLKELNPDFDSASVKHTVKDGQVTDLQLLAVGLVDISPVRALRGLQKLVCTGTGFGKPAPLADLSALRGLALEVLDCFHTRVSDLSALQGMPLRDLKCSASLIHDLTPLTNMPLTRLYIANTKITDLTPLAGMRLTLFACNDTAVSDLRPLHGMPLTLLWCYNTRVADLRPVSSAPLQELRCDPTVAAQGLSVLRSVKTLETINDLPAAEFWKQVDAGKAPDAGEAVDDAFLREVAALPAEEQVKRVVAKLKELNPGYDGVEKHEIEDGAVTALTFSTVAVADISPLRALTRMKNLKCMGEDDSRSHEVRKGLLADLSPLRGLTQLEALNCSRNKIADLSPLAGLPLQSFTSYHNYISDLGPLAGMPLRNLSLAANGIVDLSPLKGLALNQFMCNEPRVKDLSPLIGMPIRNLTLDAASIADLSPVRDLPLDIICLSNAPAGMEFLRSIKTLKTINNLPAAEFWKQVDAGKTPGVVAGDSAAWIPLDISAACNANVIRTEQDDTPQAFGVSWQTWVTTGWLRAKGSDKTGLPDDGRIAIPKMTPPGFFQIRVAPGKDSVLVSLRGQSAGAGPVSTAVTLDVPASQQREFAQLAFLHASDPGDAEVSVTIRYSTGADGQGVLHPRMWGPGYRKEPLAENETVAVRAFNSSSVPVEMTAETLPVDPQRVIKSLTFTFRWLSPKSEPLAAEKCHVGIFAISALPAATDAPAATEDAFPREVAALPPEEQVKRVVAKLKELNPAFNGQETHLVVGGNVEGLYLSAAGVTDILPVRALAKLKKLDCKGTYQHVITLSDLSPLRGLDLAHCGLSFTQVADLSPLGGMSNLSDLQLRGTRVRDLSPLKDAPLTGLDCAGTQVDDLSPLRGMPLRRLYIDFKPDRDTDILRSLKTLEIISNLPAAEFWKQADAGKVPPAAPGAGPAK